MVAAPPPCTRTSVPPPTYSPSTVYNASLSPPTYFPSPPQVPSGISSSSSSPSFSSTPTPKDTIVPAFPLLDSLSPDGSPNSRHLPHLVSSTLSLTLTKSSVQLVLAQNAVFVSPPKIDEFGLGLGDYGLEGSDDGKDARITGFVNVVAPIRKLVKGISLRLVGTQRLQWPRANAPKGSTGWTDETFFERSLLFDGDGEGKRAIWLEKGVNTWEFSFALPSTSPASDRSDSGYIEYRVHATVLGSGGYLKGDLADSKKLVVVCTPPRDDNIHQLQTHAESIHPQFGPLSFDLSSNELIVAAPLIASLTLVAPPPSLAIFGIRAYIVQTTTITSHLDPSKTAVRKSAKKWIIQEGERGGWSLPGFSERCREKGVIMAGSKVNLKEGEVWKWSKAGRFPCENDIAPTTLPGTKSSLRYSNELFAEAIFDMDDESPNVVQIAPLFQRKVMLASCCCMIIQLALPNYAEQCSTTKPCRREDGCIQCMCEMRWEPLKEAELALMRNGGGEVQGVEGIEERRRGGLCHRVAEFGGSPPVLEAEEVVAAEDEGETEGLGLSNVGLVEQRKAGESF